MSWQPVKKKEGKKRTMKSVPIAHPYATVSRITTLYTEECRWIQDDLNGGGMHSENTYWKWRKFVQEQTNEHFSIGTNIQQMNNGFINKAADK